MGSLANSHKAARLDPPTQLKLTFSASLNKIPLQGMWSKGPVYQRLDSGFLQQPSIPKAPPAPRLQIHQVNGSLRVFDPVHSPEFSGIPPTVSLPELRHTDHPAPSTSRKSHYRYQMAAVAAGFAAGLAAAFLFGWL